MKPSEENAQGFWCGMRQSGFLAAAGIYALENNAKRLKEDHAKQRPGQRITKSKLGEVGDAGRYEHCATEVAPGLTPEKV